MDMIVEIALFTAVVLGILSVSQPAGSAVVGTKNLSLYKNHVVLMNNIFLLLETSIGDVKLSDLDTQGTGTVNIYFTDGIHTPQWGTICGKKSLPNVAKVVCRQLGYSDGDKSLARPPSVSRSCHNIYVCVCVNLSLDFLSA